MHFFSATDIGTSRQTNQDAYFNAVLSPNAVLCIVCDGMGGANAGNIASQTAVNIISDYIKRSFMPDMKPNSVKNMILSAVDSANTEILHLANNNPNYEGRGTTAVVALVVSDKAYIAHVGDSRAYLINDNTITQITNDHSMIQSLIENGHLTPEEARFHPKRNIITRAIGIKDTISTDFIDIDLNEGILFLCTDGVSNVVTPENILEFVNNTQLSGVPEEVIKFANNSNSGDNVTVTVVSK